LQPPSPIFGEGDYRLSNKILIATKPNIEPIIHFWIFIHCGFWFRNDAILAALNITMLFIKRLAAIWIAPNAANWEYKWPSFGLVNCGKMLMNKIIAFGFNILVKRPIE